MNMMVDGTICLDKAETNYQDSLALTKLRVMSSTYFLVHSILTSKCFLTLLFLNLIFEVVKYLKTQTFYMPPNYPLPEAHTSF